MFQKRTNILFDTTLWKRLSSHAKESKTSIGAIVRKAVVLYLDHQILYRRRADTIDMVMDERPLIRGKLDYRALSSNERKH